MYQFTVAFLFGALVASGWWAMAVFGWPQPHGGEIWRLAVGVLTILGTIVAGLMIAVGAMIDADRSASDESTEEEETE